MPDRGRNCVKTEEEFEFFLTEFLLDGSWERKGIMGEKGEEEN